MTAEIVIPIYNSLSEQEKERFKSLILNKELEKKTSIGMTRKEIRDDLLKNYLKPKS